MGSVISVACPEVLPNTEKRDASVDNFVPQHFLITSNEETEAGERRADQWVRQ